MMKLRLRVVKVLVYSCTVNKWNLSDLKLGLFNSKVHTPFIKVGYLLRIQFSSFPAIVTFQSMSLSPEL